ncbi:hypothetical protein CFELI_14125 [Corynebacterium felinum]|nr:hypothetical protein CFELI_14125 [Corynebacterium felinum]
MTSYTAHAYVGCGVCFLLIDAHTMPTVTLLRATLGIVVSGMLVNLCFEAPISNAGAVDQSQSHPSPISREYEDTEVKRR